MRTLSPATDFLRVGDKFFPSFILADSEIKTGATLLYLYLSHVSGHQDRCWPSQETLARVCKCSVKTVQTHLQQLIKAQYIHVEKKAGHSVYVLLLSPRVERLLARTGTDMVRVDSASAGEKSAHVDTKNLRARGEKFTPYRAFYS